MSQAQYDIYRGKVFSLVRSMIIKSAAAADAFNKGLEEIKGYRINRADPAGWKYYLNLNGQYHSTDKPMQVTSLDTLQTIEFKKEVLLDHRSTMREYAYGSSFYNALVARFPDQELLVQGILNPIDIPTAIAAKDGQVLYYDRSLVEENETNLIPELSLWCQNFTNRWNVPAYGEVDDLYPAVHMLTMVAMLPSVVMNLRLRNCHTLYAHSFHIREYLASNGKLDADYDYLTKRQALWLYRNIRYLLRNAGKQETFYTLIQHVLTERGLPLAEWRMRHNVKDQAEDIYPDVEFSRRNINIAFSSAGSDTRTIPQMLDAEQPLARGNAEVQADAEGTIKELMENSLNNRLDTKVLESSILDLTDASPFTLSDTLLNHWMYFAQTGRYISVVTVDNIKSGGTITLSVKEAFIVFLYAYNLSMGIRLIQIPRLQAMMVRRDPLPSKAQVKSIVDPTLVSDRIIDALMDNLTVLGTYISIPSFSDACYAIHAEKLRQRLIYSNQGHYLARGQAEAAMQHLYCDYPIDMEPGESYAAWFADKGLDIPTFNEKEAEELAGQLYSYCTGANLKVTQSLKEMQAAMLRLMTRMSSYSVQFLQSINSGAINIVDWPLIRPGDANNYARHVEYVHAIDFDLQRIDAKRYRYDLLDLSDVGLDLTIDSKLYTSDAIDVGLEEETQGHSRRSTRVVTTMVDVLLVHNNISELGGDTPILSTYDYVAPGYTSLSQAFNTVSSDHYALTQPERTEVFARWQAYLDANSPFKTPLVDVWPINRLPSLLSFLRE